MTVIVRASDNKNNMLELKPNVTRRDIAEYNEALQSGDENGIEKVLRRTVLDITLDIGDEIVKGLDDVLEITEDQWLDAPASTNYFWQRAWLVAFNEAQKLGNPTRRG